MDPQRLDDQAPALNSATESSSLAARYRQVRAASVALAAHLTPEDCQLQSMPDASPTKWHLAHTTWFFETFVIATAGGDATWAKADPIYRVLFNSYYNGIGEQYPRPRRGLISRPSLEEVLAYRERIDALMMTLLEDPDANIDAVTETGLQHEQQHQELILTDILHAMSCNPLEPAVRPGEVPRHGDITPLKWIDLPGGSVEIGHDARGFGFDNESPRHQVLLYPCQIASRPVNAAEYMAFIEDGGYQRPELWLSDGWDAVRRHGWEAPQYWRRDQDGWTQFTLRGRFTVDPAAPVCHVSLYEADAYARWAGARLPTEFEWEHAAAGLPVDGNFADGPWMVCPPAIADSLPVQLYGDVWEWTASPYRPYPGYQPATGALGEYNGKFMSDQWVLKGGSLATPRGHVRASYRNFFQAPARWQFTGIRLARDAG